MGGRGSNAGGASVGAISGRIVSNYSANAKLTPAQSTAFNEYQDDDSGVAGRSTMNQALADPKTMADLPAAARQRLNERAAQIDAAIAAAPALPERTSIYVTMNNPKMEQYIREHANDMQNISSTQSGKGLPLKGFVTGSLKRSDTYGDGMVVKVNIPKGHKALYSSGNGTTIGENLTIGRNLQARISKIRMGNGQVVFEVDLK